MAVYLHHLAPSYDALDPFDWGDTTARAPFETIEEALAQASVDIQGGRDVDSIREEDGTVVKTLDEIRAANEESLHWLRATQADSMERSAQEDTTATVEDVAARAERLRNE